ncbi:type II toxin-antitoxin system RelE/ParE family toxin [Pararhizobium sp. BT-229]|uniref:type II toxin-antitoxin system RelE/ParE family toxin n=1 Tax=Pararhizobium sp. BT-229 TaxID=2986923 RepID=UPI0021F73B56|nr:type II toxin-antitoxin system RelE/ParE family toxin [Pararhizobium sp. BT-229]MCV9965831.1 type II toxin-antitoxin system RelE/ParE family toxin [Pararhizobium sp. BT-229]
MNYIVGFDASARADIKDLYRYILTNAGEQVADAYVGRLMDYCAGFETFPERGSRRDDISPGLRLVGYRRQATIAFRIRGNTVTIVRIFHSGKNVIL